MDMAIWQVCFYVIDKNKKVDDEDIYYWSKEPHCVNNITFLAKCNSWSKKIIQYGNSESTCIELLLENGSVVEISVRLDMRTLTKELLANIEDYVVRLDGNIFYQDKIVRPSMESLMRVITDSEAYKYCKNPLHYFDTNDSK